MERSTVWIAVGSELSSRKECKKAHPIQFTGRMMRTYRRDCSSCETKALTVVLAAEAEFSFASRSSYININILRKRYSWLPHKTVGFLCKLQLWLPAQRLKLQWRDTLLLSNSSWCGGIKRLRWRWYGMRYDKWGCWPSMHHLPTAYPTRRWNALFISFSVMHYWYWMSHIHNFRFYKTVATIGITTAI